jgi:hypothetical protein
LDAAAALVRHITVTSVSDLLSVLKEELGSLKVHGPVDSVDQVVEVAMQAETVVNPSVVAEDQEVSIEDPLVPIVEEVHVNQVGQSEVKSTQVVGQVAPWIRALDKGCCHRCGRHHAVASCSLCDAVLCRCCVVRWQNRPWCHDCAPGPSEVCTVDVMQEVKDLVDMAQHNEVDMTEMVGAAENQGGTVPNVAGWLPPPQPKVYNFKRGYLIPCKTCGRGSLFGCCNGCLPYGDGGRVKT